jgi:hypothetical protein
VAHACNSNYTGGRGQEDCRLKPAWANSSVRPYLKKKKKKKNQHKNRAGALAQGGGSEFKPQYCKKKKEKDIKLENPENNEVKYSPIRTILD